MAKNGSKKRTKGFWHSITHPQHKTKLFVVFNLIIAISTIIITIFDIIYGTANGQSKMIIQGWNYFIPFTINSNILMAIASIIALVKLYHYRHSPDNNLDDFSYGHKFTNYYFMATVSLNLTAAGYRNTISNSFPFD